jgi:hypothetical protein
MLAEVDLGKINPKPGVDLALFLFLVLISIPTNLALPVLLLAAVKPDLDQVLELDADAEEDPFLDFDSFLGLLLPPDFLDLELEDDLFFDFEGCIASVYCTRRTRRK